ncbi:DNA methyltransferase [uncultured Christiangramia sp.]|uniref:DNA methyltransferase n=1 Tax=uncultured Christiangramia sp. TaxID=503836 RepID=UPI002629642D|nr:DNA methyltransferase [uncultured Christiangramia sp.]
MINLSNENNKDLMSRYDDKYFDLAIVDPPYGIGDTWSKSRRDRFHKKGKLHSYQNESIPDPEYFSELFRVSKNQIIWGGNYFTEFIPPTNSWIVWNKLRDADKTYMSEGEAAWTSFKKVFRIVDFIWDGARKCEKTTKIHPHQKPVKLYEWILMNYATPGDKILDTHLGSGSIAIACHNLKYELTACELDTGYYKKTIERIKNHKSQMKIF